MADPPDADEDYGDSATLSADQWSALAAAALPEQPDLVVQPAEPWANQRRAAVDEVRAQSLATPRDPRVPGASYLDELAGRAPLTVELYDQPFELEPAEDQVGGFLEFAYLSGGWPGIDQATEGLNKALAAQSPPNAADLSNLIRAKTGSISLLISGYLRQLETEALRLLGQVFDERLAAIDAARKAFLDGDALRHDEDGNLPARTKALIEGLTRVKTDRADLAQIVDDNAAYQAIDLIAHRLAEELQPSGLLTTLSPDGSSKADAGDLYLLGPLAAVAGKKLAELDEELRDRRKLFATASALTTLRTKQFLESEPTAIVLVTPASAEVPVDETAVGARFSARLSELEDKIKGLQAKLAKGQLSALDAVVVDTSVRGDTPQETALLNLIDPKTPKTGAEFIGLGAQGARPEANLARLLLLRPRDGVSLANFTVWSLAPVVKQADRNLRKLDAEDTSPLVSAIYPSMQQESIAAMIAQVVGDLAFTGFMLLATALSGPAAPLLIAAELALDVGDALGATAKHLAEKEIFDADVNVLGDAAPLRALLDQAPDLSGIILAWVGLAAGGAGLAGDVLKIASTGSRQLETLQKLIPVLSKASNLLAASGLFVSLALAAESFTQPQAAEAK